MITFSASVPLRAIAVSFPLLALLAGCGGNQPTTLSTGDASLEPGVFRLTDPVVGTTTAGTIRLDVASMEALPPVIDVQGSRFVQLAVEVEPGVMSYGAEFGSAFNSLEGFDQVVLPGIQSAEVQVENLLPSEAESVSLVFQGNSDQVTFVDFVLVYALTFIPEGSRTAAAIADQANSLYPDGNVTAGSLDPVPAAANTDFIAGGDGTPDFTDAVAVYAATFIPPFQRTALSLASQINALLPDANVESSDVLAIPGQQLPDGTEIVVNDSCSLVSAIRAANLNTAIGGCRAGSSGEDVILLSQSITLVDFNNDTDGLNGLPSIETPIQIIGNGLQISGSSLNDFRIFHVSPSGSLTLRYVVVTGGRRGSGSGGAIYNRGTVVLEDRATIFGNTADNGAGIYNDGGNVTIRGEGTLIASNTADDEGGGIFNTNMGTVLIQEGARLSTNRAFSFSSGDGGGAICNDSGSITINGGVLISENISDNGGGILNRSILNISDSDTRIENNTATGDGGGIKNEGTLQVEGIVISNNTANDDGGGIVNFFGTAQIEGVTISSNSAADVGGGIVNAESGTLTIQGGTVISNNVASAGGGLFNDDSRAFSSGDPLPSVSIVNTIISANELSGGVSGGGIDNRGNLNITNSCIIDNADTSFQSTTDAIARGNWWGSATGPGEPRATISGNIDTSNFLTSPILGCP